MLDRLAVSDSLPASEVSQSRLRRPEVDEGGLKVELRGWLATLVDEEEASLRGISLTKVASRDGRCTVAPDDFKCADLLHICTCSSWTVASTVCISICTSLAYFNLSSCC